MGFKQAPSVTLYADLLYNRPVCQAQLREPRKRDFTPFFFCASGEDKQLAPGVKVFFLRSYVVTPEILLLSPSKETSVSCAFTIAVKMSRCHRSEDVSVLAVKIVTQCLVSQEAAVSRLACQVSP